jgi:predicted HAD superfamily phosphohydrolase YqeG
MTASYVRVTDLRAVLACARQLSVQTLIIDIEPLVAWWNTSQGALDEGIASLAAELAGVPELRAAVFATNSARQPSVIPSMPGVRVLYLASAGKPLRTAQYQALPRPGAVIGDQLPTDGLLAARLGYTFLHWSPPLSGIPPGPRLMRLLGRLARPLVFGRDAPPADDRAGEP